MKQKMPSAKQKKVPAAKKNAAVTEDKDDDDEGALSSGKYTTLMMMMMMVVVKARLAMGILIFSRLLLVRLANMNNYDKKISKEMIYFYATLGLSQ